MDLLKMLESEDFARKKGSGKIRLKYCNGVITQVKVRDKVWDVVRKKEAIMLTSNFLNFNDVIISDTAIVTKKFFIKKSSFFSLMADSSTYLQHTFFKFVNIDGLNGQSFEFSTHTGSLNALLHMISYYNEPEKAPKGELVVYINDLEKVAVRKYELNTKYPDSSSFSKYFFWDNF